jgi:hypothetical protein
VGNLWEEGIPEFPTPEGAAKEFRRFLRRASVRRKGAMEGERKFGGGIVRLGKIGGVCLLMAFATASGTNGRRAGFRVTNAAANAAACSSAEYRQFDFWIGDWDAFDADNPGKAVARNQVEPILQGCVVREDYRATSGTEGESFSIYDVSRNVWHQTWVTNRGVLLVIEGSFQNGEMVLSGADPAKGGEIVRGVWKPVDGGVQETATLSADGGKTWKPWFDILFRPHKP